ncbi:MAG: shikimate dehydrogenase, partial [Candidatus Omnitrophica bacterium]|nr:shikimate dehydrogenase [Candidatus Omnitrophota bacterium]
LFSVKDLSGFNITIPHKVKAREILEKEFPFAQSSSVTEEVLYYVQLSGAVNTVKRSADKLEYRNTDALGFMESLKKGLNFSIQNKNILLIGCGGAGRAVIAALSWKQNKVKNIYITDINDEAINSAKGYFQGLGFPHLDNKLKFIPNKDIPDFIESCDLLVNATPCGMEENDPCVVDEKIIRRNLAVFDLIYNPKETKLLKIAREKGAAAINGLGMLLYQGARAFEFWTGKKAPIEEMREALKEGVKTL